MLKREDLKVGDLILFQPALRDHEILFIGRDLIFTRNQEGRECTFDVEIVLRNAKKKPTKKTYRETRVYFRSFDGLIKNMPIDYYENQPAKWRQSHPILHTQEISFEYEEES